MDLELKGKRALVTGATRGMGRAIAETLAGEACKLSICARNDKEVAATVETLQALQQQHRGLSQKISQLFWTGAGAMLVVGFVVSAVSFFAALSNIDSWIDRLAQDRVTQDRVTQDRETAAEAERGPTERPVIEGRRR